MHPRREPRTRTRRRNRRTRRAMALAGAALIAAGSLLATGRADAQDGTVTLASALPDHAVLTVDVSQPYKDVDHAASGSLYGIGDEGWPPDEWIAPTNPKSFVQPPPGATHQPNGEPEPVGDTLDVWQAAARHDAVVTIRMPDIFPTFPYQWQGDDYWYTQVERIVREVQASGMDNVYGYEIWNEPQWTWQDSWGDYFEMWDRTYRLIRELDPDTPIIGPSYDRDYEAGLREFMTHVAEADTVPDIVSWHELGPESGLDVEEHIGMYRDIERDLGVEPRPISINEYGSPRDAGVPGWLTRFVSRMERTQVDTANLAFWHKPGRLSDLLVPAGGGSGPARDPEPTGNYWVFDWYGDMTGQMVRTIPPETTGGRSIEVGEPTPLPATRTTSREGFGNAIGLGGEENNDYVELPQNITQGLSDFTVSAWIKPAQIGTWARVFDFGSGQSSNMFLTLNAGGAGPRFSITTGGGGAEQRITSTAGQLPAGEWAHVAVTKSGTTGTLWINGEAVGTNDNLTLSPDALGATTQNWIGKSQYPDPLFDGLVDDVQLYDHGLDQAGIQALMSAPGTGDLAGNVASYAFDEADGTAVTDASGNGNGARVVTGTTGVEYIPVLEGFASADDATNTARVVFGGGEGDIQLKVEGLSSLSGFGRQADVQVFTTEWTGTDGVSTGPVALFEGRYPVRDGAISVPVDGLKQTDAYLAVITPAGDSADFPGPVRRYEARGGDTAASPLASGNSYVRDADWLSFTVDAPVAGAYDLGIRYANPAGAAASGSLAVNGGAAGPVRFEPTGDPGPFATHTTQVVLREGRNRITLTPGEGVGVDHIEVTPFRTRVQAESGEWSGAQLVEQDMSEANFGAAYFSGDAYVRGLSQPESSLRLPVTVPEAGTYRLTICYTTAGTEEERRAQITSGHLLRVNDGAAQEVTYAPTQYREMIRQTTVEVELPAGESTLTFTKADQPGVVDLDYVDVELAH
jgi:hypothetical protein